MSKGSFFDTSKYVFYRFFFIFSFLQKLFRSFHTFGKPCRVSSLNMDQSCNMDHRHNSLDIAAGEVKLATFDALAPRLSAPWTQWMYCCVCVSGDYFAILSQFDEDFWVW